MRSRKPRGMKWPVRSKLMLGNVIDMLKRIPAKSVHCAVTSPPYWRLRDYGVKGQMGQEALHDCNGWVTGKNCGACYVCHMRQVAKELHRALRDDGTLWLNLGDSYATSGVGKKHARAAYTGILAKKTNAAQWDGSTQKVDQSYMATSKRTVAERRKAAALQQQHREDKTTVYRTIWAQDGSARPVKSGKLKDSDLIGIPWRVALALQADGWYLRSDVIWAKANPAPESVSGRPARSHEYIFMLTKKPKYYYDHIAVRQQSTQASGPGRTDYAMIDNTDGQEKAAEGSTRNLWTVWNIVNPGTTDEHAAAYPPKVVETCIMASTSERGCCPKCGTGWVRRLSREESHLNAHAKRMITKVDESREETWAGARPWSTVGWHPNCECFGHFVEKVSKKTMASGRVRQFKQHIYVPDGKQPDPIPAIVLDPFVGSGTTVVVAKYLGRSGIGIDLGKNYLKIAQRRLHQVQAPWYQKITPVG